jgi:hypothetical protein
LCIHSANRARDCEDVGHRHGGGIEKFFEDAFYPALEGKEPAPVTPELIARLMAARHGQTALPPAHS